MLPSDSGPAVAAAWFPEHHHNPPLKFYISIPPVPSMPKKAYLNNQESKRGGERDTKSHIANNSFLLYEWVPGILISGNVFGDPSRSGPSSVTYSEQPFQKGLPLPRGIQSMKRPYESINNSRLENPDRDCCASIHLFSCFGATRHLKKKKGKDVWSCLLIFSETMSISARKITSCGSEFQSQ